jgi:hypothetical protein
LATSKILPIDLDRWVKIAILAAPPKVLFLGRALISYAFQFEIARHEVKKKLVFPKVKRAAQRRFELESVSKSSYWKICVIGVIPGGKESFL